MTQLPDLDDMQLKHGTYVIERASEKKYGYVFLVREKKHHDWKCKAFFWCAGNVCHRNAEIYFSENGHVEEDYKLQSIVDMRTWEGYQKTYAKREAEKQSIKQVKVKTKK